MPIAGGNGNMTNEPPEGTYRSNHVFTTETLTNQEREAAEVLLLMGNIGARKTIITEHRSVPTNNNLLGLPVKNNQCNNTAVVPSTTASNNVSVITEPAAFVSVNRGSSFKGSSSSIYPSSHIPVGYNSGYPSHSAISYQPIRSPPVNVDSHNIPISVVKRKETIGSRPQRIYPLSPQPPPLISVSQPSTPSSHSQAAITIKPLPKFCAVARTQQTIFSDETEPLILQPSKPLNKDKITDYPLPYGPSTTTLPQRNSSFNDRHVIPPSIPINVRETEPKHHSSSVVPSWIISNLENAPDGGVIRIVSPSQITAGGNVNGANTTTSGLLLPGSMSGTLIHFSPNSMYNNNKSDYLQGNVRVSNKETLEQQKLLQNKLMKKALRAKIPLSRDATKAITVDEFTIPREFWAKAFVQSDICHAAGILFKALFTPQEIQNCTLRGRNGTFLLDLQKRSAIFRAVGWMKNKNQNPYSFDSKKLSNVEFLTQEEKMIIEKKVFVERRYQTSRKIREVPSVRKQNKEIRRNHNKKNNNSNPTITISSEESNPSVEIIVKAEPSDVYEDHNSHNNEESISCSNTTSEVVIKTEREDEPMEINEDIKIDVNAETVLLKLRNSASEENQPPSPKQLKLA